MKKFRELRSREQLSLLPKSVEEYVEAEDLVRYVDAVVEELDLSEIEGAYSYTGRRGYAPRVLVKILIFGMLRGIRSSRILARSVRENLKFIYLAQEERPDFRTISDFRKRFSKELAGLFVQTVKLGIEERVITLEHVAIDGTKIGAYAGRRSFKTKETLEKALSTLEEQIAGEILKEVELEEEQEGKGGWDPAKEIKLPEEMQTKEALRKRIKEALAKNEQQKTASKLVSTTEIDSRFMRTQGGGKSPSYNAFVAVDADSNMAVAGYATNTPNEASELCPHLEEIEANTGMNPVEVSADKGFSAFEGVAELERRNIDGYVPQKKGRSNRFTLQDFDYNEEKDCYFCPNGKELHYQHTCLKKQYKRYAYDGCAGCPLVEKCMPASEKKNKRALCVSLHQGAVNRMREKIKSPYGKQISRKRAATVEPVFGHLKANRKLRQFIFRGINMVKDMWRLELAAFNIEKLARLFLGKKIRCYTT